jgi:hypothetical protein
MDGLALNALDTNAIVVARTFISMKKLEIKTYLTITQNALAKIYGMKIT